ncbi:MAG: esterase-like activity of phytase family protein [Actinomycetota bacterium]
MLTFTALRDRTLRLFTLACVILAIFTVCTLPALAAKDRTFLDFSLEFLGEYQLPKTTFEGTPVSGLSAITYDPQGTTTFPSPSFRFYALSDDRSAYAPARFYTLRLDLAPPGSTGIQKVAVEAVTYLTDSEGQPFPWSTLNPEGLSLSPRNSVFVASEGITSQGIAPFIREFDLKTGKQRSDLPIPSRYLPDTPDEKQQQGVVNNLGFESLTLDPESFSPGGRDPFRLFTAVESPLVQDRDAEATKVRLLHYVIADRSPYLVSEHLYTLDPGPWTLLNGLTELVAIGKGGHFLSLERSFGLSGYKAKVFQVAVGGATDTSRIASLKGPLTNVEPVKKKLLLDFSDLGIPLYNLEGMTLGPRLPDGSQSLLLVSDDNFDRAQKTQFLLFRLKSN